MSRLSATWPGGRGRVSAHSETVTVTPSLVAAAPARALTQAASDRQLGPVTGMTVTVTVPVCLLSV
jgi:hypothetical protein